MSASNTRGLLAAATIALMSWGASAQSLNIRITGGATYSYDSASARTATFGNGGHTITVCGNEYSLASVALIYVGSETVAPGTVNITYTDGSAEVLVAADVAPYVTAMVSGANVKISQSTNVSDSTCGEITYNLTGSSASGSFSLSGDYKTTVALSGLNLTNPAGAALSIDNGKRIALKLTEGTVSTLTDSAGGSHKGAIVCKGHLEFKGKGSLDVTGNTAHAIYSKEYVELKNATVTVHGAVKDGINCSQYFKMDSGNLTIERSGDDGIQASYKDTENREAEDTGSITVNGGTLTINTQAKAAKCLKADNEVIVSGGNLTLEVSGGGMWDAEKTKTKAAACIGADGNVTVAGGSLHLTATGGGGKGISTDGTLTVADGAIWIKTTGGLFAYVNGVENQNYTGTADRIASDYKSSPKGMKADGAVTLQGGTIDIATSGNGAEGIESKSTLTVSGGTVNIKAYDDGMNSSSHMLIEGGDVCVVSTAGDGLDSNANLTIAGGKVRTFASKSPECGLDAATENGYSVMLKGGSLLSGGSNSTPSASLSTQPYVTVSTTPTAGVAVTVKDGDTELASFTVPTFYGSTGTPLGVVAMGPGGGGPGGSSSGMMLSAPGMVKGKSYSITIGSTTTTAVAK